MASHFGIPDEKKNIVWVLTFGGEHKTGFAVTKNGHIMTTAHFYNTGEESLIKARRLDQETVYIAELVEIRTKWNLAMLKVNTKTPFGEFPSNGNLTADQSLLYIGHPGGDIGCCLYGRVSFPFVDKVTLPTDGDTSTCGDHRSEGTPTCRELGQIYNFNYFSKFENQEVVYGDLKFKKNLHPHIPIIQANGFLWKDAYHGSFGGAGFEGGPVFDCRGQVVGMMFTEEEGCQLGIHVSLLKHFMGLCNLP